MPKLRFAALRLATGAEPVPPKATMCGLPVALSLMAIEAKRLPSAAGVNVTSITQFAPAATEDPQVFVWEKSPTLAPVTARLVIAKAALPMLLTEIICAVLVVPRV